MNDKKIHLFNAHFSYRKPNPIKKGGKVENPKKISYDLLPNLKILYLTKFRVLHDVAADCFVIMKDENKKYR